MKPEQMERLKLFLDYLHVEMNIAALLAAFCVSIVPLVFNWLRDKDNPIGNAIWAGGWIYVVSGSLMFCAAALSFYRLRSNLAWAYGQLCHSVQDPHIECEDRKEVLEYVDGWDLWMHYKRGFAFLVSGMFLYGASLLSVKLPQLADDAAALRSSILIPSAVFLAMWVWHRMERLTYKDK